MVVCKGGNITSTNVSRNMLHGCCDPRAVQARPDQSNEPWGHTPVQEARGADVCSVGLQCHAELLKCVHQQGRVRWRAQ
eukprot:2511667-Amphidinium_carterae.1